MRKAADPVRLQTRLNGPAFRIGVTARSRDARELAEYFDALKAAGKRSEIVIYPDAGHGFNADYRPSYNPQAAKDGWNRMQEWFKEHGVA